MSFGSKCAALKKVLVILLGLLRSLQWFVAPKWFSARDLYPLLPLANSMYVWCSSKRVLLFHKVPTRFWKCEKGLVFKIGFQDLEKGLNLAKKEHTVTKKCWNFKLSHSPIWILHFPPMTISQIFFALCSMYKIKKMKMSDGNKVFSFGIEKV